MNVSFYGLFKLLSRYFLSRTPIAGRDRGPVRSANSVVTPTLTQHSIPARLPGRQTVVLLPGLPNLPYLPHPPDLPELPCYLFEMVTEAVAIFVGSATAAALTVTTAGAGTAFGAR